MMPGGPEMGMGPGPMTPPPAYGGGPGPDVSAINERIEDLLVRMSALEKGNTDLRNELADMKDVIADLKGKYVHIQEEASVKLEEYSKDLESVGAHIKALERVLQRVFSATAQNMRELSEIVKSMKGKVGPAQEEQPKKRSPLVSE
jgi:predicted RNase H-like nuclease (RuvC/YqgF family)